MTWAFSYFCCMFHTHHNKISYLDLTCLIVRIQYRRSVEIIQLPRLPDNFFLAQTIKNNRKTNTITWESIKISVKRSVVKQFSNRNRLEVPKKVSCPLWPFLPFVLTFRPQEAFLLIFLSPLLVSHALLLLEFVLRIWLKLKKGSNLFSSLAIF